MEKAPLIIFIAIAVFLLAGGIIYWTNLPKSGIPPAEKKSEEPGKAEKADLGVLSLSAIVSSVDEENNFLIVKPLKSEKEIKVLLSESTRLTKLEFPFDPKNPPQQATFAPKQIEIEIQDIKPGDNIFIKTNKDVAGKTEFDNVDFIQVMP